MVRRSTVGVDLGDLLVAPFRLGENFECILHHVASVLNCGATPILVGGDHSITYPAVSAVAERYRELRLVQFDAHHDATEPSEWNCDYNHGTFIRNLINDGAVRGSHVAQVGVRDFQWSASGADFVRRSGVHVFRLPDVSSNDGEEFLALLRDWRGQPVYLTFDVDCVDPAHAPGTGEVMPGGFSAREVFALVDGTLRTGVHLVGLDLVEVNPTSDVGGRTCALAAHVLALIVDHLGGAG